MIKKLWEALSIRLIIVKRKIVSKLPKSPQLNHRLIASKTRKLTKIALPSKLWEKFQVELIIPLSSW